MVGKYSTPYSSKVLHSEAQELSPIEGPDAMALQWSLYG